MSSFEWTNIDYLILRKNCREPLAILCKIFPDCTETELRLKLNRMGINEDALLSYRTKQIPSDYRAKDKQFQYHADSGLIEYVNKCKCENGTYNDCRCLKEKELNGK